MTQRSQTYPFSTWLQALWPVFLALAFTLPGDAGAAAQKAAEIQVKGANKAQKENILVHLGGIERDQLDDLLTIQGQVREKAHTAMQALGYFNAGFKVEVRDEKLVITVEPGPPTTIKALDLQVTGAGESHARLRELIARTPLAVGQTFVSTNYESFKTTLLSTAQQAGYLQADYYTSSVAIDTQLQQAAIKLSLETGAQYHFGQLSFSDSKIALARLQQLAQWQEQAQFSLATLNALQKRLTDTGYFQSVILEKHIDHQQAQVNIHAKLVMAKPNKLVSGVGFGTDTGPRARLGWAKPWVNAAGHSMDAELAGSSIEQNFTAAYKIPSTRRRESYWKTELKLSEADYEDTRSSAQ
ncbi:MAG: hypothetical protein HKO71_08775, partial [Pseudomonadales bacterium]|nr:hypothetical protein [Pseudomonadales bacterium]